MKVALARCDDYDPARLAQVIRRQFELLGGVERFVKPGDRVLLKPNFIAPRSHKRSAAQTHPAVILQTAKLLKEFGARPFVADSPAWTNTAMCTRVLGLTEPLRQLGVPVRELDAPRKCHLGPGRPRVKISSVALDADVVINLPKLKAHQQLAATIAVKNMFGCVSGKRKALWHFKKGDDPAEFCKLLIGIYERVAPALTIVDGIVAMEGQGPIRGPSKPLGWLVGSTDPIACELTCCRLIGVAPERIPIIQTARQIGFGCTNGDEIEIVGDALPPTPCPDFQMPRMAPIKFSFTHVCRSAARQIVLLARPSKTKNAQPSDY